MVNLLQRYESLSDADAVAAAENDRRWQLVLGCIGREKAPFGQGSVVRFRLRMIEHDLDKKLVDRTVELANRTGKFGWKALRVAIDSSPLPGAGRVEDTWNLIGRAMAKVVATVSTVLDMDDEQVIAAAGLTTLRAESLKAALDIDWTDEDAQHEALQMLVGQATALETWVRKRAKANAEKPPLSSELELLRRLVAQDIEPDPDGGGVRIRDGVAEERVLSISDREMCHGRKSRSTRIDGYRRHIAIANGVVLATAVMPANRQEHAVLESLVAAAGRHGPLEVLDIVRGYLASPAVGELRASGVTIHSRAWRGSDRGFFRKEDFHIEPLSTEGVLHRCPRALDPPAPARANADRAATRPGDPHRPRRAAQAGWRRARAARLGAIQGTKARYRGARKNELDVNRAAALVNLHEYAGLRTAHRRSAA